MAQLLIKAITLLENAGAKVDSMVSDGASSNQKLWCELGVSGKINYVKNKFDHQLDKKRHIFVFSDAPHLIKNVRIIIYYICGYLTKQFTKYTTCVICKTTIMG